MDFPNSHKYQWDVKDLSGETEIYNQHKWHNATITTNSQNIYMTNWIVEIYTSSKISCNFFIPSFFRDFNELTDCLRERDMWDE